MTGSFMRRVIALIEQIDLRDDRPEAELAEDAPPSRTHPNALDPIASNTGTLDAIDPEFEARSDALRQHHHSVEDDATFDTLRRYTEISGRLSRGLVSGAKPDREDARQIRTVDRFLKGAQPLAEPITVYSALGFMPEGDVLTSPAFLSTSLDPRRAAAHANDRRLARRADVDVIARFELPEGYTGGRYLGVYGKYRGEMEYLIRRAERFRIVDRAEHALDGSNGAFTRIVLTVVPA